MYIMSRGDSCKGAHALQARAPITLGPRLSHLLAPEGLSEDWRGEMPGLGQDDVTALGVSGSAENRDLVQLVAPGHQEGNVRPLR